MMLRNRAEEKLAETICNINNGTLPIEESAAESLFLRCRQVMEFHNVSDQYPSLITTCNLVAHDKLDRKKHFLTLRTVSQLIEDELKYPVGSEDIVRAFGMRSAFAEFEDVLERYSLPSITDSRNFHSIAVNLLRSVQGKDISARKEVFAESGQVRLEKAIALGISNSSVVVASYGIRRWESETRLELFDCEIETYGVHCGKKVYLRTGFYKGACLVCQSLDVVVVDGDRCRCAACNTEHRMDWSEEKHGRY